jgi:hypothetical protein
MRRLFTPAQKPYIIPAIVQGSVFAAGFLITTAIAAHVSLHMWPSTSSDDVRTDLFLPVYGTAYVVSCLLSYLSGKLILGKRLTAGTHLRFALWAPFFFVVTYVIIAAFFLVELAIGLQNGPIDRGIMYCAFFASMSIGYFCILTPWREINR